MGDLISVRCGVAPAFFRTHTLFGYQISTGLMQDLLGLEERKTTRNPETPTTGDHVHARDGGACVQHLIKVFGTSCNVRVVVRATLPR